MTASTEQTVRKADEDRRVAGPNPTAIDAYAPAEIARRTRTAGVGKAKLAIVPLVTLAVLAGAFIALGALLFTQVMTGSEGMLTGGPQKWLGGIAFSLGLILVIVGGGELFTGNALIVMAAVERLVGARALLRNWGVAYLGNAVGAVGIALAVQRTGLLDGEMGATARAIATAKVALPLDEAFWRGVLCNVLVCLAVWLSLAARSVTGKVVVIVPPVAAFVALGLEHSVANLYLVPQGFLAGADIALADFATTLAAVTLGNVVGGAGGVGLAYALAYRETLQRRSMRFLDLPSHDGRA